MAQPDFSEFTFGYSVTRHFETIYGGRHALPNFPTQPQEADAGFDVDFLSHGIPLFIQFKRSEIMTRRSATEWKKHPGEWTLPIYRMHLHGHNEYHQHYLMQNLEDEGNIAIYATSSVRNKSALNWHYSHNRSIEAARMFLPSEIVLPNTHERHHVAFNAGVDAHRVYSETGERVTSRITSEGALLELLRTQGDRSVGSTRQGLERFVDQISALGAARVADIQRERRPVKTTQPINPRDDELNGKFATGEYVLEQAREAPKSITSAGFYDRLQSIQSVVVRAAIAAYHEADAHLISVSRSVL